MSTLTEIITSPDPAVRDQSLDAFCRHADAAALLTECEALEIFRKHSSNLYERVRALFFLYAIHRFHLPGKTGIQAKGNVPFEGYEHVLARRFEEAIAAFLHAQQTYGPNEAISSALAEAYHKLAFQTLADQVRRSVRSARGNQWMFRVGHPADQPLRIHRELAKGVERGASGESSSHTLRLTLHALRAFPILRERTPVRMDLSHSAWSDIFFLGMDFPEGARVLNVSIDLAVQGRDGEPRPPVEAYLRVIDEPVLRLTSVDLGASADIILLSDVFDFAKDYLGLLKAAVIASGIVPPGIEGCPDVRDGVNSLQALLARIVGPGMGLELVSNVNDIPKGSRLAVSTNLLASLISACMRATGQTELLTGMLQENERRLVAARALLGEWLAGSGGGWQDSGGVWPGMKLITGVLAREDDIEYGVSRGCLLPIHKILDEQDAPHAVRQALQDSLILVHGGMAQNVGPILEMVTEKYLLRSEAEWIGRTEAIGVVEEILELLRGAKGEGRGAKGEGRGARGEGRGAKGETDDSLHAPRSSPQATIRAIAAATTRNFFGPLQTIIPWASNAYTETLIARAREAFGKQFWGFWMLGGMSGGGMGFIVAPEIKAQAQIKLQEIMSQTKSEMQSALPFAMEPVVYDFAINPRGTFADLLQDEAALMPPSYYALHMPQLVRMDRRSLSPSRREEMDRFGAAARHQPELSGMVQTLFDRLLPRMAGEAGGKSIGKTQSLDDLLQSLGFDREQHEQVRADMKSGRIGLAQNRLPASSVIEDVHPGDVIDGTKIDAASDVYRIGLNALTSGQVAVVSLAGGAGSRWTQGAGVVKSLHPFIKMAGQHRTFVDIHLAKTRKVAQQYGIAIPHIFTTSYLTHEAIEAALGRETKSEGREARGENRSSPLALRPSLFASPLAQAPYVLLSPGRSIGLRMIPMARDLRFQFEEVPQQLLDEQKQKMRESVHAALIHWAQGAGEGNDYTDNLSAQCLHPVGHWFELPNMLRNGVLHDLLKGQPQLKYFMLHNIDTTGVNLDPGILGLHIAQGSGLSFEVITRRIEDRGGGLARVDGHVRLVEGLAMPHERDEFGLSYYNSATAWIDIDQLLTTFGLTRADLGDEDKVARAVRILAARMPTYITLKDVKKRWGHGQEDILPVAQFEKLWGDMTALPDIKTSFIAVPRMRGQQLKDIAQLDGWLRDGSAAYVEGLCAWG